MPKLSLSLAAAALLGGGLGATSHATVAAGGDPEPAPAAVAAPAANPATPASPSESCLAQTICSVKERIRWQTPAWTPSQCRKIADAVNDSAKRHDPSPTLLLPIMVNENDMNDKP